MAYSKPKPAFGIDQILNKTHSSPSLLVSHPAQLAELPPRASSYGIAHHEPMFDPYTLNMHPPSYFPANIPPPYFSPTYHHVTDQYPPAIHKVHDFWSVYSHPFGGYFLPAYAFKRKGGQIRFTPQQVQHLEQQFTSHKYLSPDERKKLASRLKLSDRQVKTWFQNRRAKHRRVTVDPNARSPSDGMTAASSCTEPSSSSSYASTSASHTDSPSIYERTFSRHNTRL